MTKYYIIGILNLLFGAIGIIYPLIILIITIPRLTATYTDLGIETPLFITTYLILGIIILMGAGNFFFGFNLVSKSEKKDRYFKHASILLITSLLLGGFLSIITILSIIMPLYNLTAQL